MLLLLFQNWSPSDLGKLREKKTLLCDRPQKHGWEKKAHHLSFLGRRKIQQLDEDEGFGDEKEREILEVWGEQSEKSGEDEMRKVEEHLLHFSRGWLLAVVAVVAVVVVVVIEVVGRGLVEFGESEAKDLILSCGEVVEVILKRWEERVRQPFQMRFCWQHFLVEEVGRLGEVLVASQNDLLCIHCPKTPKESSEEGEVTHKVKK